MTSQQMHKLLGHINWSCLVFRPSLSIVSACYFFAHAGLSKPSRLWSKVRQELRWVIGLLPLFQRNLGMEWSTLVAASDFSESGYGVCRKPLDLPTTVALGRQSEKWRWLSGAEAAPRKRALLQLPVPPDHSAAVSFAEVPKCVTDREGWQLVCHGAWRFQENILRTEGRAAFLGLRHLLRTHRNFGCHLVQLVDNLPLALTLNKGRGKQQLN
eukprot:4451388-Amphidinium_carterae.1